MADYLIDLNHFGVESIKATLQPVILANNSPNERMVSMPWYSDFGLLYYRKDLLEQYNFTVPQTWAEVEAAALAILAGETAAGRGAQLMGYSFQGKSYEGLTCNFLEWVAGRGGGAFIETNTDNTTSSITINNAATVESVRMMKRWLGTIAPYDVIEFNEAASDVPFLAGNAIFMRNWPYVLSLTAGSPIEGKFGVAYLPGGTAGQGRATIGGWGVGVSKRSRNVGLAVEYCKFLASPAEQMYSAAKLNQIPVLIPSALPDLDTLCNRSVPSFCDLPNPQLVARPSTVSAPQYTAVTRLLWTFAHDAIVGTDDVQAMLDALECDLSSVTGFAVARCFRPGEGPEPFHIQPWFIGTCFAVIFALALFGAIIWYSRLLYIRRERILRDAKDTAEKASLMKSEFLANMSHEIRTPLSGIIGNAQLLRMTGMTLEQSEYAHQIEDSSTHLLTVINDILHVSRLDAGGVDLEDLPFELSSCIEQAIHLGFKSGQDDAFDVFYFLDPRLPQLIRGDSTRLRQILINLIGNALKFSRGEVKRGQVVVYARLLYQQPCPTPMRPSVAPVGLAAKFRSKLSRNDSFHVGRTSVSEDPQSHNDSTALNSRRHASTLGRNHAREESLHMRTGSGTIGGGASGPQPNANNQVATPVFSPTLSATVHQLTISNPLPPAALQHSTIRSSPVTPAAIGSNPVKFFPSSNQPQLSQADNIHHLTRSLPAHVPSSPIMTQRQTQAHIDALPDLATRHTHIPKSPRGQQAPIPEHALRALSPGEILVEFEVEDCGCGIPADKIDRLFKAFSQVDSSISRTHGGTGLGLSISLGLTKLMGGKLRVKSEVKKGSSFFFTVITRDGAAETSMAAERPQHAFCTDESAPVPALNASALLAGAVASGFPPVRCFQGARQLVILVHENLAFHAAMAEQFSRWKLSLICATSPDQVLAWMQNKEARPELDQDDLPVRFFPAIILCDTFFPGSPSRCINASLFAMEFNRFMHASGAPPVPLILLRPSNLTPDGTSTPRDSSASMRDLWSNPAASRASPSAHLLHLDDASIERLFVRSVRKPVMFTHLYRVLWNLLRGDPTPPQAIRRVLTARSDTASPLNARSSGNGPLLVHITEEKEQPASSDGQARRVVAPIILPNPADVTPSSSSSSMSTPASAASGDVWTPAAAPGSLLPMRILIADDDSTNRKLLKRFLLKLGYDSTTLSIAQNIARCTDTGVSIASSSVGNEESAASAASKKLTGTLSPLGDVECAEDGLEAVERLKANHADLVLMDMQMPKCSGIEATQRILSWYKNDFPSEIALRNSPPRPVPPYVVALTANVLGEHKQQCFDAGMSSFMTKPFTMKALAAMLAAAGQQLYAQHCALRDRVTPFVMTPLAPASIVSSAALLPSPSPNSASPLLTPSPVVSSPITTASQRLLGLAATDSSPLPAHSAGKPIRSVMSPAVAATDHSTPSLQPASCVESHHKPVLLHLDSPLSRATPAPHVHDPALLTSLHRLSTGLPSSRAVTTNANPAAAATTQRTLTDEHCAISVQEFEAQ